MSARIFPFIGSPLPDIVYLDTSFVWEVNNPDASDAIRQAACRAFINRLTQARVMMVINPWVIQELRHVILIGVYRKEAQRRQMSWGRLFRQDKSLMPTVIQLIQQVEAVVDAHSLIVRLPIHLGVTTDAVALDFRHVSNFRKNVLTLLGSGNVLRIAYSVSFTQYAIRNTHHAVSKCKHIFETCPNEGMFQIFSKIC